VRDRLHRAKDATRIATRFSQRVLGLAGARRPHCNTFALDAHLTEAWCTMSRVLGERMQIHFYPGAPKAHVHIDKSELDGALLNLLINARDACHSGGTITLSSQPDTIREINTRQKTHAQPGN